MKNVRDDDAVFLPKAAPMACCREGDNSRTKWPTLSTEARLRSRLMFSLANFGEKLRPLDAPGSVPCIA